jgi:L-cysteine:1D-myo-inositol 2-amino-2-deoxy-alpha-D-glucopyranoside ligase
MARHHYRDAWSHSVQELQEADDLAQKLKNALAVRGGNLDARDEQRELDDFVTAMEDDLDTPTAIAHLEKLADYVLNAANDGRNVEAAQATLLSISGVLGLHPDSERPGEDVVQPWRRYRQNFT